MREEELRIRKQLNLGGKATEYAGSVEELIADVQSLLHSERQSILKATESKKRELDPEDKFGRPCDCICCIKNIGYNQALSDIATEIERRDK